jgi:branched-chain amino acid transport system substrate-binding protein
MKASARSIVLAAALEACSALATASASAQGVKIGVLNDQSGTFADFDGKGSVEAAKMAIEDFGGSVLGQKIELVSADHQNRVDVATAIARRWYDVEGVDVITDLTLSSVALAVQQIAPRRRRSTSSWRRRRRR